jgi:F-type H+-transporting ATPase subunit alpha
MTVKSDILDRVGDAVSVMENVLQEHEPKAEVGRYGVVTFVGEGVVEAEGLGGAMSEEVLEIEGGLTGMAFNVGEKRTGIIMLDKTEKLSAGAEVRRTGRVMDVPVGRGVMGRIIDPRGKALDGKGPLRAARRMPVERPAPAILDRLPVTQPLQTGIKVVDALIPIGRGQRELILGDRQTGKTAVAVDAILNQAETGVKCFYCAAGKRSSAVTRVVDDLVRRGAMDYTAVVVATEGDPPAMQFLAPYATASMAEYYMEQGEDTLVIFDDLTRHARAYRELSLLLRRPPGREAYPGDIFYVHSRLLERSTHLSKELGGGSMTALPIIETEAQNISAYIPTNLISITDGQIYLSPDLFRKGILPPVDVGKSVSRVGGKTQLPAYRKVAGDLRLSYSQFEELESFARFGTRLDEETRSKLDRGRRVREVLKQPRYGTLRVSEQIATLVAVNEGVFDDLGLDDVAESERKVREAVLEDLPELCEAIERGEKLSDEDVRKIAEVARRTALERIT